MPASGAAARAIKETAPDQKVLMVGGHVAALPARTLEEEACDYVAGGEGLFTIVELARALKASPSRPELGKVRGLWYRENGKLSANPSAPAAAERRRGDARRRLGLASHGEIPGPQLALLRPPGAAALRGDLYDAGLPVPLHVLLHPGPFQERREGAGPQGNGQQLPLLEPQAGRRRTGKTRRNGRAEHQDRRRDVRAQ